MRVSGYQVLYNPVTVMRGAIAASCAYYGDNVCVCLDALPSSKAITGRSGANVTLVFFKDCTIKTNDCVF